MTKFSRYAAVLLPAVLAACAARTPSQDIVYRVENIQREASFDKRHELAMALSRRIVEMPNKNRMDEATISKITELLGDGATRLWAAAMLRQLGPQAKSAIPALKRALAEEESQFLLHNQTLPAVYIRMALGAIDAEGCTPDPCWPPPERLQ